jgi:molybdopterin/thiamine biosynthesis adenylyltransferase
MSMAPVELSESRYHRQELLHWWDQRRLRGARCLVVGAGALGNEIVKNLALLGAGQLTIVDLDVVERSNLARCVLFREADEGRPKAAVAARAARELNPEVDTEALTGSITAHGLGWLRGFDVVLAGLDNREARVWLNQACRKLGMPWVDGAIEGLRGLVRVFGAEGPCYECTLGAVDRELLARRRSCALLSTEELLAGKVPTTATSASVVAALEVQEAVKLLHRDRDLGATAGRGLLFVGETLEVHPVVYGEDPECLAHDTYGDLVPWPYGPATTLRELFAAAGDTLPGGQVADLEDGIVVSMRCLACATAVGRPRRLSAVAPAAGRCPRCDQPMQLDVRHRVEPADPIAAIPLAELALPDRDVVTVRGSGRRVHFELQATV